MWLVLQSFVSNVLHFESPVQILVEKDTSKLMDPNYFLQQAVKVLTVSHIT